MRSEHLWPLIEDTGDDTQLEAKYTKLVLADLKEIVSKVRELDMGAGVIGGGVGWTKTLKELYTLAGIDPNGETK